MLEHSSLNSTPQHFIEAWRTTRVKPRWCSSSSRSQQNYAHRDHAILYAVFAGSLELTSPTFDCHLQSGSAVIVPPSHQHHSRFTSAGRFNNVIRLGFHLEAEDAEPIGHSALPVVIPMHDVEAWLQHAKTIAATLERKRKQSDYPLRQLLSKPHAEWLILHHFLTGFQQGLLTWSNNGGMTELAQAAVLRLRQASMRDMPSIGTLAKELGISNRSLLRAFREHLNTTPQAFRRGMLLQHASRMLASNLEFNVEDIARHCGFKSPAAFGRAFKKIYGISPLRYRKKS